MNILFITQLFPFKKGNPQTSGALREFIEEWGNNGHRIKVIRPHFKYQSEEFPPTNKFSIGEKIDVEFIKPLRIPLLKYSFYNNRKIISQLEFKPDVIICHLYNSYFAFYKIAKRLKIPLVVGIHNSDLMLANNIFFKWRQKKVFKYAAAFACRSIAMKRMFASHFPSYESQSFVASSGLPQTFIDNAKLIQIKNIIDTEILQISTVCSLIKIKHIDRILEALSKIPKTINWCYKIIGDGPERERLEILSRNLNIDSKVIFTGAVEREHVLELLNDSHIFVLPSYPETLGLAYLEAMSCGNIVIGAKNWGIDGVIIDGINGFLCDATDSKSIENSILKALRLTSSDREKIVRKSLETISHYSMKNKANDYQMELMKICTNYS